MMDEEKRKEAQRKLNDEERIRRLREGGESMKAQLAMEEAERSRSGGSSYLTPEEEQQRRLMKGSADPYRGYGETQRAEMAMWEKEPREGTYQQGGESMEDREARDIQKEWRGESGTQAHLQGRLSPTEESRMGAPSGAGGAPGQRVHDESKYPAGRGSYYEDTFERPTGTAGPESSFGRTERMPSGKQFAEGGQGAAGKRVYDESKYPAGRGSYYEDTFEKPTGTAGPESSFGRTERTPSGRQYAEGGQGTGEVSGKRMYDESRYPAGRGSYYEDTFERPTGTAGPESSFGRTERMPSGKQYAGAQGPSPEEIAQGRMGERPSVETAPTSKMGQTAGAATGMVKEKGGQAVSKGREVGGTVVSKTRDVTSQIGTKAREFNESNRAEDIASRAGEALGKAIRRTVAVAREMTSGVRKGLEPERRPSEEKVSTGAEERTSGMERESVQREEVSRQTPQGEERRYQEIRKKENQ